MTYTGILIGANAEIVEASDKTLVGRTGLILDETKNTIILETKEKGSNPKKQVTVAKKNITIRVSSAKAQVLLLRGTEILGSPQERIKG